jgi:hypothetical protein
MSAVGLISSCVQTAWRAKPGSTVSMLSLDLAGAYDNVPHHRLIGILHKKGIPEWLIRVIASFLRERRTRIAYPGYTSEWINTNTGIPQGSPLSPILFLFFISELLERFQDPEQGTLGVGFVDDTNLITWGESAADNCRRLTTAHAECESWAAENGARFAPEKYQLIHFTRRRRHAREDLASTVRIGEHQVELQKKDIRVLGVWLDPALTWKEHITHATNKGLAASEALARLATSTWGPSARHSRLLYTAVIRPILLNGSQEWSMRSDGRPQAITAIAPLQKVQNECLRRITGAYKRTPRKALEREACIMPLDLYIETTRYRRADKTRNHEVETQIARTANVIWHQMRRARGPCPRPPTGREASAAQASAKIQEAKEWLEKNPPRSHRSHRSHSQRILSDDSLIKKWGELTWQRRWEDAVRSLPNGHRATVWLTPWAQDPRKLYAGLSKAETTALFLLRTEIIGLNAWLAAIQVPGIPPTCPCGWHAQTVRHIVLHCPRHDRTSLLTQCGTERLEEMLMSPASAKHAARWLVHSGILQQFRTAAEIANEDTSDYRAFIDAERW